MVVFQKLEIGNARIESREHRPGTQRRGARHQRGNVAQQIRFASGQQDQQQRTEQRQEQQQFQHEQPFTPGVSNASVEILFFIALNYASITHGLAP